FYYFQILTYLNHFKMMADLRKTTMSHITITHLRTSYITIPPLNLINDLDKRLDPIFKRFVTNQKQNQELSALRDWLLPMLMNGQVKVLVHYPKEQQEELSVAAEPKEAYENAQQ